METSACNAVHLCAGNSKRGEGDTEINSHIYYDEQEPQQGSGTIPSFNFCKTGQWCFFFIIT